METKQVLSVDEEVANEMPISAMANGNNNVDAMKKEGQEEVPAVLELNSSDEKSQTSVDQPAVVQPAVTPPQVEQKKVEEPLVLNSSTN